MTNHSNPIQRQVIRKRIHDDCLLDGELHPSIAERLERVRELPVGRVANLLGVERDSEGVWLVWQFIEGKPLDQFLSEVHSEVERKEVAGQIERAVSGMHSHGIVHGAIHGRNVIIDHRGIAFLTHVSPLLWSDPQVDRDAIAALAARLGQGHQASLTVQESKSHSEKALRWKLRLAALGVVMLAFFAVVAILWYISHSSN